jgi:diaminopimelate epimerase
VLLKVEGAGNDFILGTGQSAERLSDDVGLVRRLCHRRTGIGADGTLALFALDDVRVQVVYRNADGGRAAFCANATRCAARVAVEVLGLPPELAIVTDWVEVPARVRDGVVTLDLPAPPAAPRRLFLEAVGRSWEGRLLEVGVPHLVVPVEGLAALAVEEVGRALRDHPRLAPDQANVSFVELVDSGRLAVRSIERGLDSEPLCCGSGVVAAALVSLVGPARRLECVPLSGDRLVVEALAEPPVSASRLTGPARIVAVIDPNAEWLAGDTID